MKKEIKEKSKKRYTREELLDYLRMFVRNNNSIPTATDFHARLLPDYVVYKRHFGGIEKARQEAGVYEMIR